MLGQPVWTLTGYHMFSMLDTYQAQTTVLSLGRAIGKYQLSVNFSPEGSGDYGSDHYLSPFGFGYTYSGGKHVLAGAVRGHHVAVVRLDDLALGLTHGGPGPPSSVCGSPLDPRRRIMYNANGRLRSGE